MTRAIGRFAPSPTGPLHLGSLVAAVGSWLFARSSGGSWLVRMEDLDTQRVVPDASAGILRTLERYGLEWDGEALLQSNRIGDFVLKRADGAYAYQLAVVVDDAFQGVTEIVRGADLLSSTARQIALRRALGFPVPAHAHLPLVVGPDGRKIGKREGALPLESLDDGQVRRALRTALGVLGQIAVGGAPGEMLRAATASFDPGRIPRGPVAALGPGESFSALAG